MTCAKCNFWRRETDSTGKCCRYAPHPIVGEDDNKRRVILPIGLKHKMVSGAESLPFVVLRLPVENQISLLADRRPKQSPHA